MFHGYRTLTLTAPQRAELERVRDADRRPYLRERAAALLKVADGWSAHGVAREGLLKPRDPDTVYAWLGRYERQGLAGLVQRPRRHRGFPPSAGEELAEVVHRPPCLHGIERSRWRLRDLRQAVPWLASYTLAAISRALRRLRIRRKRGRLSVTSPDPAYDRKLDLIDQAVALARACPDEVVAVYGDEYTLGRQPKLGPTWAGPGPEPRAKLVAGPAYTYRYGGALDAVRGSVIWDAAQVFGVSKLRRLLRRLRAAYPTQTLFLVWDNWPIHQHPDVLARASELGIQILWLPTYAPWTNPIEKPWRWLIEDHLRHHRLAERWAELKQKVAAFLDQFAGGSADLLRYVGLLPS